MHVHLLAPPNVQTTPEYYLDGFGMLTQRFAELLRRIGAEVTLYASEENTAPCARMIRCVTKEEQTRLLGATPYQSADFNPGHPLFLTKDRAPYNPDVLGMPNGRGVSLA